jgi:hypothetical protein
LLKVVCGGGSSVWLNGDVNVVLVVCFAAVAFACDATYVDRLMAGILVERDVTIVLKA